MGVATTSGVIQVGSLCWSWAILLNMGISSRNVYTHISAYHMVSIRWLSALFIWTTTCLFQIGDFTTAVKITNESLSLGKWPRAHTAITGQYDDTFVSVMC